MESDMRITKCNGMPSLGLNSVLVYTLYINYRFIYRNCTVSLEVSVKTWLASSYHSLNLLLNRNSYTKANQQHLQPQIMKNLTKSPFELQHGFFA